MLKRAISGILFVAIIIGAILLGFYSFYLVMGTVLVTSLKEFIGFSDFLPNWTPSKTVFYFFNIASFVLFFLYYQSIISLVWLVVIIAFMLYNLFFLELFRNSSGSIFNNLGGYFISFFYITLPILLSIYLGYYSYLGSEDKGYQLLLLYFIILWVNDTFAYLTGKFIGKHKLIPNISPNKTIEGLFGGIFFSLLITLFLNHYFFHFTILKIVTIIVIITSCGVMGDLIASKIKRELKLKDTGSIIPGHGGAIDRFDAFFLSMPCFFMYMLIF